jgi:hypothetical protein
VAVGFADGAAITVDAAGGPDVPTGKPWPPVKGDRVRLTLTASRSGGLRLTAGAGTVSRVDSLVARVPPKGEQEKSARFIATIDVDRVATDIDEACAVEVKPGKPRFRKGAFRGFVRRLRGMVEGAAEPKLLTLAEIRSTEFGEVLMSNYYAVGTAPGGAPLHRVATKLYPEPGEMPREWYQRVDAAVGERNDLMAGRLVSLEIRDIVHADFSWLTKLVFAAVILSLLWSFRSMRWSAVSLLPVFVSFALMLATMLLIRHRMNLMNVLVFPILVGIGIDYGIHVVHRFRDSVPVSVIVTETGRAFVLTTLTTMAGFGSLILSRYKGLSSFGFVTLLGMSFVLLTSLVALPALLELLHRRTRAKDVGEGAAEGSGDAEGKEARA